MSHSLIVVSLGPGDPELLNLKTVRAIKTSQCLVLLTSRHGITQWLDEEGIPYTTLDDLFNTSVDFDAFHQAAYEYVEKKVLISPVVFAVPDASSDLTVRYLLQNRKDSMDIRIIPGTGYQDVFISESMELMPESRLHITSAYDCLSGDYNPNDPLLILEIDNELLAGQVKVFLSDFLDDDATILFLRIGASPVLIPLYELDRQKSYNHQTAVMIPPSDYLHRNKFVLQDLISIMDKLRSYNGCPWDREQTHRSLRPYLAEEAWECIASIDQEDMEHFSDELGDLLLQIVFHASIGKQYDEFTFHDVCSSICRKMIRRHPHVFSAIEEKTAEAVPDLWEKIKQAETGRTGMVESLDDISSYLPSLKYASKLLKKLHSLKAFHRQDSQIIDEIRQNLEHINVGSASDREKAAGLLLLLMTELSNQWGADSELALHQAAAQLKQKVQRDEKEMKRRGNTIESLTFAQLGVYLDHVEGEIS